jgi:RNA recognition motif-containing protein
MRVNPDETQSVASHDSNTENNKEADQPAGEAGGETAALDTQAKEQSARSRNDADKAKTSRPVVASGRNLWVSGLCQTTRAKDLKELFSKYGKVEGAKVNIEKNLFLFQHTQKRNFLFQIFLQFKKYHRRFVVTLSL